MVVNRQQISCIGGSFLNLGEVVEEIEDEIFVDVAAWWTLDYWYTDLEGKVDDVWVDVYGVEEKLRQGEEEVAVLEVLELARRACDYWNRAFLDEVDDDHHDSGVEILPVLEVGTEDGNDQEH